LKILLTGGSGFLGSALALHLRIAGYDTALLLRLGSSLDRMHGQESAFDIGRCANDIEIDDFIDRIRPDVIIHAACAYGRQGEDLLQLADTNVRLGITILQSLLKIGRPITFINTGTVLPPEVSPYALSKHQFTQWGRSAVRMSAGKLRFINVLLQHMYGPGDDRSKFTTHVLHACHRNEPELKLTLGEQKRDFIYIDDVVSAYSRLVEHREELAPTLDVELGSGFAPSVREYTETAHRLTHSTTKLIFGALPYRENEAMHCQADLTFLRKLGWKPEYDLESGLQKTLEKEGLK
jgi:CDP-paratose synthetase